MLLLGVQKSIMNFFPAFNQQIKNQGEMRTCGQADRRWQLRWLLKYHQKKNIESLEHLTETWGHYSVTATDVHMEENTELHSVYSVKEIKEIYCLP